MPPESPFTIVKFRYSVSQKIIEIKDYIDNQRGNDPNDLTGLKVVKRILENLNDIRFEAWMDSRIPDMGANYRKRKVGNNYLAYYYIDESNARILLFELRHARQKPLSVSTLRKYKRETENQ